MHKLWITFSLKMQHHLTKSFVSRMQLKKVFSQRKWKPRSNRLYIEGYQEIDVGLNDLGNELLQSSKIYNSWSWPKSLYLNWLVPPIVSWWDMQGLNLLSSTITVMVTVWVSDNWIISGSMKVGVHTKVYVFQLHKFQRIFKIIFRKTSNIKIFFYFWLLLSQTIYTSLRDSSMLMIFLIMATRLSFKLCKRFSSQPICVCSQCISYG